MFHTKQVDKIKTHILCSVTFFFFENRVVYEITWKNIAQRGRGTDDNKARAHCMPDN